LAKSLCAKDKQAARGGERLYNIVVACRAEAERRQVDLARPMAAINTGL